MNHDYVTFVDYCARGNTFKGQPLAKVATKLKGAQGSMAA